MAIREITANGIDALNLVTRLLQRSRLADPVAGIWEAADTQWSWRMRRESDDTEKVFWIDDNGPIAGIWLTNSATGSWQVDPIIVPHSTGITPDIVWNRALNIIGDNPGWNADVPVADDDPVFQQLAHESGLTAADQDFTGWMNAGSKPATTQIAVGFKLVDRFQREHITHPMADRSGDQIAERLRECTLYDPTLDLAIETTDGQIAGYSMYWFDPVTKVGLVEPVRVHGEFQRKGLARAMVTNGIERLVAKGTEHIKVSWETEAAGALYLGVGFQQQSTTTWYSAPKS